MEEPKYITIEVSKLDKILMSCLMANVHDGVIYTARDIKKALIEANEFEIEYHDEYFSTRPMRSQNEIKTDIFNKEAKAVEVLNKEWQHIPINTDVKQ